MIRGVNKMSKIEDQRNNEMKDKIEKTLNDYAQGDDNTSAGFDILRWARKGYLAYKAPDEVEEEVDEYTNGSLSYYNKN